MTDERPLDQRILLRMGQLDRLLNVWGWPLRWCLGPLVTEMAEWAREARKLSLALDEIADDAREQAHLAEVQTKHAGQQAVSELDRIVKDHRKDGTL